MSEEYIPKIKNFGCRLNSQSVLEPDRVVHLQGGLLSSFIVVPLKVAVRVSGGVKSFQIDDTPINQNYSVWKKINGSIIHGSSWQETTPIARNVGIYSGASHQNVLTSKSVDERYTLFVGGWAYQGRGGEYGGYGTPETEGPDTPTILSVYFRYSKYISSSSSPSPKSSPNSSSPSSSPSSPPSSVSFQSYSTLQGLGANHFVYLEFFGIRYALGGWLIKSDGEPTPPSWVIKPLEFFEMEDDQGNPFYDKKTGKPL